MLSTPDLYTLVSAAAEGEKELASFDRALLTAGIGNVNLLRVSSILPPGAEFVKEMALPPGSLLPIAYGSISSSEPGALIAAAVAVGLGPSTDDFGVIMEFSGHCAQQEAEDEVKEMVTKAFQYRGKELIEIKVTGVEHHVQCCGCVFAGVPLWYK